MNLIKVNGRLLELLLLNALKGNKAYGYELTNRFAPVYRISSGVIYLALKSLCERGLISGTVNYLPEESESTIR